MWKNIVILSFLFVTNLNAEIKILAFAGSTRSDSANKKLVVEAARLARTMDAQVTYVDLKDYALPFYDGDLEDGEGMPQNAKHLRQLMIQSDLIFIASPNYNGSPSAVLKNALDWVSRDENGGASRKAFQGKKFFLMSASPGLKGGVKGLPPLRVVIENIGGRVIEQFSVPDAYHAFDDQGHLVDAILTKELRRKIASTIEAGSSAD
jgi:NAD(P)H-dependent FMN reductase